MNCEEAQDLITALIDDELSEWESASIKSHLEQCVRCQTMHQQERALKAEVRMAAASVTAPQVMASTAALIAATTTRTQTILAAYSRQRGRGRARR